MPAIPIAVTVLTILVARIRRPAGSLVGGRLQNAQAPATTMAANATNPCSFGRAFQAMMVNGTGRIATIQASESRVGDGAET